ncbi:class I SAM-dependent methyltransferase [Salinibacterium sp. G-O1]|uniref:class I SAM-dependent methyltransferase n=1 Tax=Salinibacterium sp. G-O1 TaxID=3046208 RepID=UPI0024BB5805|nr:class I SAM-dependent methyltransferase [Salinibacterium sp. G-O1]MDJ0336015.1 class I SAM-dependent methyltransferase [Salinibacterium sp. G-O1]
MPIGQVTRGTTGTNRLRRIDRWIAQLPVLRQAPTALVVDLGYGASATTSLELHQRLARVRPDVEVVGIEIEPERVRIASLSSRRGVSFRLGGFEVPGEAPTIIRALNVLRQYDESQVLENWRRMVGRLQPGGVLVEGTCNEVGRVASWVDVTAAGPQTLTVSLRLADLDRPSIVAERLPKVLIHRNVPGESVHSYLADLDRWWQVHAPLSVYGPSQRWAAVAASMKQSWPIQGTKARWRLGELTVAWDAVAPRGFEW